MDRLLARLERSIGRFAIPHLILYVVAAMGMVWALSFARPEVLDRLAFDPDLIGSGQVWRLFTFLLLPVGGSPVWVLFKLYIAWWVGSALEEHWGAFKFNAYYFMGVLGSVAAAYVGGPQTNIWLHASLFLAFATTFPDAQLTLYFLVPIRAKWLGLLTGLMLGYSLVTGATSVRVSILAAFVNYLLFFTGHWVSFLRHRNVIVRQRAKLEQFKNDEPVFGHRVCAICGAREADGVDIRVCSCDKCGGKPRTLCLEHARNH
jgi:hypothetical protein